MHEEMYLRYEVTWRTSTVQTRFIRTEVVCCLWRVCNSPLQEIADTGRTRAHQLLERYHVCGGIESVLDSGEFTY